MSLSSYAAPTKPFPNRPAGTERLPINNQCIPKADLYSMQQAYAAKRELKLLREKEAELNRKKRAEKKEELNKMNAMLVNSQMVKCC